MDPNRTLDRLRDLLGEHDKPMSADESREAGELFTSLDEWLTRGGFTPSDWFPKRKDARGITEQNQPAHLDKLPAGYRWVTAYEAEAASASGDFSGMVQVRKGGTDDAPWTDLAVPWGYHATKAYRND